MKPIRWLLLSLLIVLVMDGLTKAWAEQMLALHEPVPIIGEFFQLKLGYNTGVAFGLFANGRVLPLIVTGGIIIGMAIGFIRALRVGEFSSATGLPIGLFFGGAIANFADRLPDGRVTDFLDVGLGALRWPTFNVADSFIVLGVAILLWLSLISKQPEQDQQL